MNDKRFRQLLEGFLTETLTSAELKAFLDAVHQKSSGEVLLQHLQEKISRPSTHEDPALAQASLQAFMAKTRQQPASVVEMQTTTRSQIWLRTSLRYVAAFAALAIGLAVLLMRRGARPEQTKTPLIASVLAPADHQAQLRLGDGTTIILDSQASTRQVLAREEATFVVDSNELSYSPTGKGRTVAGPSELATGKGYQVRVELPDGTRAWLNAKSSLRFNTDVQSGTRALELEGEGYFEVSPLPANPFVVKTFRASVAVIGTSFNIRSYREDSSLSASIYDGSVRVTDNDRTTIVNRGEQLSIRAGGGWVKTGESSLQAAIGWKNKLFLFQRATLPTIMAELSRWYNIEYEIEPGNNRTFSGTIPRSENLSTVLEVLQEGGITYRKAGNKLVFFR